MFAQSLVGLLQVSLLVATPGVLASPFVNDFRASQEFGPDKRALLPVCSSSSLLNLRVGSVVGVNLGLGVGLGLTGQPVCTLPLPAGCIPSTTSTSSAAPTSTKTSATPTSTSNVCTSSDAVKITGILKALISKISSTVASLDGKTDPTSALKTITAALNGVTTELTGSGIHIGKCGSIITTLGNILNAILSKLNLYGVGGLAGAASNGALGELDAALKGLLGIAGATVDGSTFTIATALKSVLTTIGHLGLNLTDGFLSNLL